MAITFNPFTGNFDFTTSPGGSSKQIQFNSSGVFGGATGFEWQNADPHVLLQSQSNNNRALVIKAHSGSQSVHILDINDASDATQIYVSKSGGLVANSLQIPTLTGGSVLFIGSGGAVTEDNSNLYWNDINNRLGIGTSSPSYPLQVQASTGKGILIAGTALNGTSDTTDGLALISSSTGAGNRQLAVFASEQISNPGYYGFRYIVGFDVPIIDAVNGDGSAVANLIIAQSGSRVGIGFDAGTAQSSLTALIHLNSGTATAGSAPLKFTSGTSLSSPEAGATEWDGTNLFITQTSGPTRKTIAYTTDIPTGAALTRTNDTNVTLTLGGSPNTALINAASITVGWSGQLAISRGGTGQATASAAFDALSPMTTLGDIIYGGTSGTNTRLAGTTTSTKKFLRQTGTGSGSAAPAWDTVVASDVPGSALTKTDDTNVTLTLGGAPTTALLNAASLTLGWSGQLAITRGGTGQSTANAAFNALAPSQTSNSGKFLTTNGTNTSWATVAVSPAGSTGDIQYNNAGAFGATTGLTWQNANPHVALIIQNAGYRGITIQGATSQTANHFESIDDGGFQMITMSKAGVLKLFGTTDTVQNIILANSSQTANMAEYKSSTGGFWSGLTPTGNFLVGQQNPNDNAGFIVVKTPSNALYSTYFGYSGLYAELSTFNSVNNASTIGNNTLVNVTGSSASQYAYGGFFQVFHKSSGASNRIYGFFAQIGVETAAASNAAETIASWCNIYSPNATYHMGTFKGYALTNQSTATLSPTAYGLYFDDVTGIGTTAYAFYTQGGLHRLGDAVNIIGKSDTKQLIVKANGTQTANLEEWQNSSATTLAAMGPAGKVTTYSSVATTGWGVPAIYGTGRSTGQTGAVASVATYTVGASDGSFIVSANVLVTTATLHNFTATVAYTDEGNTARTLTLTFSLLAGTLGTAIANAAGAVPYEGVPLHIRCKASTAITIATTGTFTTCTYNVEGSIVQIS